MLFMGIILVERMKYKCGILEGPHMRTKSFQHLANGFKTIKHDEVTV